METEGRRSDLDNVLGWELISRWGGSLSVVFFLEGVLWGFLLLEDIDIQVMKSTILLL